MKKFVLTIIALTFAASPAFAQWGDVSGYADQAGTSCSIPDVGAGIHDIFLIIKHNTGGVRVVKFKVTWTHTMTPVGETVVPGFVSIGTAANGIEVGFPDCHPEDLYFMKVTFFGSGSSPACSYFSVVAHPLSEVPGEVIQVDCNLPFGNIHAIPGGQAIINTVPVTCDCNVAVNETTWGAVKALYR